MASLKYWLWLTTRKGLRPEHAVRLLEHFGTPEGAYFADPGEYDLLSDLPLPVRTALQEKHLAEAEGILADCERLGLRILTLGDADYPDRLKNIYDPPAVLYVKGRLPAFDEEIAVAVVGSRRPSEYGKRMAGRLGLELAREGALVVSGIAQGLDTEAVRGALKGGGPVVSGVLFPCGNSAVCGSCLGRCRGFCTGCGVIFFCLSHSLPPDSIAGQAAPPPGRAAAPCTGEAPETASASG